MSGFRGRALLGCALAALLALQAAAIFRVAFNWDEFALLDDVALTAREGQLHSSGHAGLPQLALLPLVADCHDEIAVGRAARGAWLLLTVAYAAGLFALLREMAADGPRRNHDAALGTASLVLLPAFLEWSIQVRTDQVALASGVWGAMALLSSRRRPALAVLAGAACGVGWLGTQKIFYVAALAGLLAAGDLALRGEWRTRRELARAAAALAGFGAMVLGFRQLVKASFQLPEVHTALRGIAPEVASNYFDIFDFYRHTIGYSQYLELLPTLGPHMLLLAGLALAPLLCPAARTRRMALAWVVLALGFAVAAFHAAAFAYFVMTLGLFPAAAFAIALPDLRRAVAQWEPRLGGPIAIVLWTALALQAAVHGVGALADTQAVQRESLRFVHRNFAPERAGFQPEAALFCGARQPLGVWFSSRIYRAFAGERREERIRTLLYQFRTEPIHYLVQSFRLNQFPEEITDFWRDHYQPYRGSVLVAGRLLEGGPGGSEDFDLLIDGPYRWLPLDGRQPLHVDGEPLAAGGIRMLNAGDHEAEYSEAHTRGMLVLALDEPPGPAPQRFYKSY